MLEYIWRISLEKLLERVKSNIINRINSTLKDFILQINLIKKQLHKNIQFKISEEEKLYKKVNNFKEEIKTNVEKDSTLKKKESKIGIEEKFKLNKKEVGGMSITKQKLEFIVDEVFKMNTQEEISISFTENLEIKDLKIMFLNDIYNLESKSKIVMSSDLKKLNKVIDNAITGICDILQNYKNLLSKYIDKNHKILVKHFIVECIVFKRHLEKRDDNIKELINNTAIIIKDDLNKIIKDYEYKFIKQMLN